MLEMKKTISAPIRTRVVKFIPAIPSEPEAPPSNSAGKWYICCNWGYPIGPQVQRIFFYPVKRGNNTRYKYVQQTSDRH